jgi:hypothetical protein
MTYQKTFKDLADSGAISGYRRKSWPLVVLTLAFTALVIGGLIYGLYNANQIEKVGRNQCLVVHDVTC